MRFIKTVICVLMLVIFSVQVSQAQTINVEIKPEDGLLSLDIPMYQKDSSRPLFVGDTTALNLDDTLRVVSSAGGDSSMAFLSWDFTGTTFEVFSDGSVQFNIIIYTGVATNATTRMFVPFDTLAVDTTGVFKWDHNLPVSEHFMYALEGVDRN